MVYSINERVSKVVWQMFVCGEINFKHKTITIFFYGHVALQSMEGYLPICSNLTNLNQIVMLFQCIEIDLNWKWYFDNFHLNAFE